MTSDAAEKLVEQGYQARREDKPAEAKARFGAAVALCRNSGAQALLAQALTGLGQIERDLGNLDAALKHYEEAVLIYRTQGDPLRLAHTIRHAGDILRNQRQLDLAAPCYIEALALYRGNSATPPLELANAIRGYALLKGDTGDTEEAGRLWREAGSLYEAVGVEAGVDEAKRRTLA